MSIGSDRLANWAVWATADNPRLDYPRICGWAREYRPPAGDIFEHNIEYRPDVDELDAEAVERHVISLPWRSRQIVQWFHLERSRVFQVARRMSCSIPEVQAVLHRVEDHLSFKTPDLYSRTGEQVTPDGYGHACTRS